MQLDGKIADSVNDQAAQSSDKLTVLSDHCRSALSVRCLPERPPSGSVDYFLPFDPNDLTTRPLQFEILSAGGSGIQTIIDMGGIDLISIAKRPYHVDFADGETFDGPAYSLFDAAGRHYLAYAASAVRDLDNFVRVFGFPPYSPPIRVTFSPKYHGKNRLFKLEILN